MALTEIPSSGMTPSEQPQELPPDVPPEAPLIDSFPGVPIESVEAPSEDFVLDAKEVIAGYEDNAEKRRKLQAELAKLDRILEAGTAHAKRIVGAVEAEGLPAELHGKLEDIAVKGQTGQQR